MPLLQVGLELCECQAEPESLKIARIMEDLGRLHYITGRYEYVLLYLVCVEVSVSFSSRTAADYYREVLRINELMYSEDSPQTIMVINNHFIIYLQWYNFVDTGKLQECPWKDWVLN